MATVTQDEQLLPDSSATASRTPFFLFALIALLMAADVVIDLRSGAPAVEFFEVIIFIAALMGIAYYWRQRIAERHRSEHLDKELGEARAEVRRWAADAQRWNQEAQEALQGLSAAIDLQF